MNHSQAKKQLRSEFQEKLDRISFGDLIAKSNNLADSFQRHIVASASFSRFSGKYVVSFYPFGSEPQINIESEAQNEPFQVSYVRIVDWTRREMVPSKARRDQPGQWEEFEVSPATKIFQPTASQPILKSDEIAAILVPGLAFTPEGERLGRGAGFYDRFLKANPEALRIGIALEEQITSSIPTDTWDEGVDVILTDQGIREVIDTKLLGQWKTQGKVKVRGN